MGRPTKKVATAATRPLTGLAAVYEDIKQGHSLRQIAMDHSVTYILHHRAIERAKKMLEKPRALLFGPREVKVYFGASGRGKTYRAVQELEAEGIPVYKVHRISGGRFLGYKGESLILWDGFVDSEIRFDNLMHLLDEWDKDVKVKPGGSEHWEAKKIVFTSIKDPALWYSTLSDDRRALLDARINEKVHVH